MTMHDDIPCTHGRLRLPRLLVYRVATPGWRRGWNLYAECGQRYGWSGRIGYAVVLGRWCISATWRRA